MYFPCGLNQCSLHYYYIRTWIFIPFFGIVKGGFLRPVLNFPAMHVFAADTVRSILTYDGSALDCLFNYVALAILLVPVILTLEAFTSNTWKGKKFWIPMTLFLFVFQVCNIYLKRAGY